VWCIFWCINRTNIYLDEEQARSLDEAARAQGISRAALIRRLIDRGLNQTDGGLESDLAAIKASFDVLSNDDDFLARGVDERSRHLDNVRRGR
jgi:metal-responsive CopG/Arc/MetJ family transcriptional regulator